MKIRRVVILLAALTGFGIAKAEIKDMPTQSMVLQNYDESRLRAEMLRRPLQPIEGIWYYADEQMTMSIEASDECGNANERVYRIVLIDSESCEVIPGTVVGYVEESVRDKKFHLWLYSERSQLTLTRPMECVATLNDDSSTLTFEKTRLKMKLRVNFIRFLPTLFRGISLYSNVQKEELPVGFKKLFPLKSGTDRLRYL